MADYRLDCCGGFPNHRSGCRSEIYIEQATRERQQAELNKAAAWNQFFSEMTDEELFRYVDEEDKKFKALELHKERKARALAYMRMTSKSSDYLDWRHSR